MLFYDSYVGKVVGKATRECGCCMPNVGIRCHVKFSGNIQYNTNPKMTNEMVESARANIGLFLHHLDPEIRRILRRLECLHLKIIKSGSPWYLTEIIYIYIYTYIYVYIYIYICVCVCVCIWAAFLH